MLANAQPIQPDIPDTELKWFISELNEVLENKTRLDASKFNVEGKHARAAVNNCGFNIVNLWSSKGFVKQASYPSRFKRIYVDEINGIPFFLPSQITELKPKATKYISPKTQVDFDNLRVNKKEILLTRSGTVGNSTIVSETLAGKIFSDDVIRIRLKDKKDVGYVYAFLKTTTGQVLLNTNNYGAVIRHIEPDHLNNIPIPKPSNAIKKKVSTLIVKSFQLRDESNNLIDKAEKLLISELKLPPLEKLLPKYFDTTKNLKNYSVPLSELNNRLDGSYHTPMVEAILEHLKKYADEVTTIQDPRISKEVVLPGRFKRVYVEKGQGVLFFGGKNIYELGPSEVKYLSLSKHSERINRELRLKENMVLVTRSGTIGRIKLVPKHFIDWVANEHIIRITPAENEVAGYLYSWLSSKHGGEFITRHTYGAVVDEIDDKQTGNVQIPLLKNKKTQKQINKNVLEANQKRYIAYLKEQESIHIVNHEVLKLPSEI